MPVDTLTLNPLMSSFVQIRSTSGLFLCVVVQGEHAADVGVFRRMSQEKTRDHSKSHVYLSISNKQTFGIHFPGW